MSTAPRARSVRTWIIAAAVALATLIGTSVIATSAEADTIAVAGVVHGPTGLPLAGVTVSGVDFNYGVPSVEGTTVSSSTGAFAFATLPAGLDTLSFSATSTTFFQYLGGTSNPNAYPNYDFSRDLSGDKIFLTVSLSASGTIAGKVSKAPSGAVAGYTVRAYSQNPDGPWSIERTTKTTSTGAYDLTGLEPGAYRLEALDTTSAHPTYTPVYSGGVTDFSTATTVGVVANKTTGYNFVVGKAGSVTGTVTGATATPPVVISKLGGVHVTVYKLSGTPGSFTSAVALDSPSAVTSSTGAYSIGGLAAGYYSLEFDPGVVASPAIQYGRTFLGGGDDPTQAAYFTIGNGTSVTGQNIQLGVTSTITGKVVDAANPATGLGNVRIEAVYTGRDADLPGEHAQVVHTADDGSFTISDLGPGTYDLYVGSNETVDSNYQNENWEWIRQIATVGPISWNNPGTANISLTAMNDSFLYATTAPQLSESVGSVGDTVSVTDGTWDASDAGSFTYQWFKEGQPIPGATTSTYTLQPGDEGFYVGAEVTAYSFGYGKATASASNPVPVGVGTLPAPSPLPSISGTNAVGDTLTVDPGGWVSGTTFEFVWETSPDGSNWDPVQDSASPTLALTGANWEANEQVRVEVFPSKVGYNGSAVIATDSGPIVQTPIQLSTPPKVTKSSTGFTLAGGTWNPTGYDTATVNWTVTLPNGTVNQYSGALGTPAAVLSLANAANGNVTVTETRTATGYPDFTGAPITAQLGAAPVPTVTNIIVGTPAVGAQLSVPTPSAWVPSAGTSTYQWEYESGTTWKAIAGAVNGNYTPTSTYLGKLLRVVTTRTDPGFTTGTLVTTATEKVAIGAAPTIFLEGSTGTLGTGDTITSIPTWFQSGVSTSFQWEYSSTASGPYTKISGATRASYLIPQNLVGKYLFVAQVGTLAGHTSAPEFRQFGQVAADQLTLVSGPKITDVNGQVTVSGLVFSPAIPANELSHLEYIWFYTDENDSNPQNTFPASATSEDLATSVAPKAHWYLYLYFPSGNFSPSSGPGSYSYSSPVPILLQKGAIVPSGPITLPASQVGQAIVPPSITWFVENPTLTYQWQYESGTTWKSISASAGGTAATFTPTPSYLGMHLRVVTTASRTDYVTTSVTSSTTTVATGAPLVPGSGPDAAGLNGYGIGASWSINPGTWNVSGLTYHYQWAFSWSSSGPWIPITGATSASYVAPDDLHGYYLQATITASKTGYANGMTTVESPALQDGQLQLHGAPVVKFASGTYTVTSPGVWAPAATSYDYDWEVFNPADDSSTQVSTTNSYTTQPSDAGKEIQLTIYPNRLNYNSGGTTFVVQQGAQLAPTSPITLTGSPVVGNTLTLNVPGWNSVSPFVAVTWYRNGVATGTNINSLTYPLTSADLGKTISAKLVASKNGYPGATFSFTSTVTYSNFVIAATTDPVISNVLADGTQVVGTTLTATSGAWNTTGLSYSYQWYRSGQPIPGATASTYTLSGTDDGQEVSVDVTAGKTDYTPVTVASQAVTVQDAPEITDSVANPLKITGTAHDGDVLTLTIAGHFSIPSTVQIQWLYSTDGGTTWFNTLWGAAGYTYTVEDGEDGLAPGDEIAAFVYATSPGYREFSGQSNALTVN